MTSKLSASLAGVVLVASFAAFSASACDRFRSPTSTQNRSPTKEASTKDVGPSHLRIYMISDLAGALEPCGCTKDQLGGLDHVASWIHSERSKSQATLLLAAGPLFFMNPILTEEHTDQDIAKAETLASSLKGLAGFTAIAPGRNDWAAGAAELAKLKDLSGGAALLLANAEADSAASTDAGQNSPKRFWDKSVLREINGIKVGIVGVSALDVPGELPIAGISVKPALAVVRDEVDQLIKKGADVIIALAAVGRGEAKRIADAIPTLTAILVASPGGRGETNSSAPPPERIGNVLIAETGNHLTSVATLDLFVRDGSYKFEDGTGLELARKRSELAARADELRIRIAAWERDSKIAKSDIDARRAELSKVESERDGLDVRPPPERGSFFRYSLKDIRQSLGSDPNVASEILTYYKKVNEHNQKVFAARMPRPHTEQEPIYVGINVCSNCHPGARAVWDKTWHARAYGTLVKEFKQFNLDCVSCHVTGYDQPGGSTVTHVERLENVQCEVCHGPGSKHALSPAAQKIPVPKPSASSCATCHHSPHVENFDAAAKMMDIIGPGHGKPL